MKLNLIFPNQDTWVIKNENKNKKPEKTIHPLKIVRIAPEQQNVHPIFLSSNRLTANATVDLRSKFPPPYDQGNLGSCTANALCAAYQFLDKTMGTPSRLFVYYNERDLIANSDEDTNEDSGAYLSDGINCLIENGVCSEASWPYIESRFSTKPIPTCYVEAESHKIMKSYTIPNTMKAMRLVLQSGRPFVTGITIYSSFESDSVAKTGLVPMPDIVNEFNLGGHAVLVCGYNDNIKWYQNKIVNNRLKQSTSSKQKGVWIVRNSWGVNWGAKGYFYLPYPYLLNTGLSSDQWVIDSVKIQPLKSAHVIPIKLMQPVYGRKPSAIFSGRFLADNLVGGGCSCGQ